MAERLIRMTGPKGRVSYLYGWSRARPECMEVSSWTPRQTKAYRYRTRSHARADLLRALDWICLEKGEKIEIVRVVGTSQAARWLVNSTRLVEQLRARGCSPRALRTAERVAARCFEDLAEDVAAVEKRRAKR